MDKEPCSVTIERLSAYVASFDQLTTGEHAPLRSHIDRCEQCQKRIEQLVVDDQLDSIKANVTAKVNYLKPEMVSSILNAFSPSNLDGSKDFTPSTEPPSHIGGYQLKNEIGRGGMGIVYRAHDSKLDRDVAVKALMPQPVSTTLRARFVREGRVMAAMDDQGIVPIFEVIDDPHISALVMPIMEGGSLRDRVDQQNYDDSQAAAWVCEVAEALVTVHRAGYIHRDIKPGNVLLDIDGKARLADFGLVRWQDDLQITESNSLPGTPEYLCPETLLSPETATEAADIYQCGVLLYELLTATPPFRGSLVAIMQQITEQDPVPPRRVRSSISRDLERVCLKAMSRRPNDRYASALDLAADLHNFLADRPVTARPIPISHRVVRYIARHPIMSASFVVTAIVLITLGSLAWINNKRAMVLASQRATLSQKATELTAQTHQLAVDVSKARGATKAAEIETEFTRGQILQAIVSGTRPTELNLSEDQVRDLFFSKLIPALENSLQVAVARSDPPETIAMHAIGVAQLSRTSLDFERAASNAQTAIDHLTKVLNTAAASQYLPQMVAAQRVLCESLIESDRIDEVTALLDRLKSDVERLLSDSPEGSTPQIEHLSMLVLSSQVHRISGRDALSAKERNSALATWQRIVAEHGSERFGQNPVWIEASRRLESELRLAGNTEFADTIAAQIKPSNK